MAILNGFCIAAGARRSGGAVHSINNGHHSIKDGAMRYVFETSASMASMMRLRDEGSPLPSAAVVLSPWTDLALTGQSLTEYRFSDPMVQVELMPRAVDLYLAGTDPRSPYASPLYGDLARLPPTLLPVCPDQARRDDAG